MFELMAELEAMCGRLAARRMSDTDHRPLVHAQEACEALSQKRDPDGYYHQNEAFHHVIYEASHNSFLAEQASALHRRLGPYRRLQLRVRDRITTSCVQHRQIVAAILEGNGDKAAELLREHVLIGAGKFTDLMASLGRMSSAPPLKPSGLKRKTRRRQFSIRQSSWFESLLIFQSANLPIYQFTRLPNGWRPNPRCQA
jgi:hypothetical protein